jgi:glycogen(starch) synthase
MRVLMLGWEYPPHISGGLGTACEGLTRALSKTNTEILFVVPRLLGGENAPHMAIVDSSRGMSAPHSRPLFSGTRQVDDESLLRTVSVPSFLRPYLTEESFKDFVTTLTSRGVRHVPVEDKVIARYKLLASAGAPPSFDRYGGDIFFEVERYAADVAQLMAHEQFDVIHAHDWMTFPAGVVLSRISGKPLVVHVHSLEFDRSGAGANPRIVDIERLGLQGADKVVAVSHYTGSLIQRLHSVPSEKISVVHNGIYSPQQVRESRERHHWQSKIVLFLGRITFQKGPDYFVEAAARVIPQVPDVLFVMAGSGDMLPRVKARVRELGIQDHFLFPGFLKGEEVEEMFSMADLYVMPSVSEPFGISALEAISCETPVIISRQSGVAEVLSHALKVDFWDLERLSDLMINALLYEELRHDMVGMARDEVKRIHWDAAAIKLLDLYRDLAA